MKSFCGNKKSFFLSTTRGKRERVNSIKFVEKKNNVRRRGMVLQQWYGRSFRSCIKSDLVKLFSNMEITKIVGVERVHGGMGGGWRASEFDEGFGETQEEKEEETTCCEENKDCCSEKEKNSVEEILGRRRRGKWIERKTIEGMPYYYNEKTEELTWDKPDALKSRIRSREKLGLELAKGETEGWVREVARESGVSNLPS